MTKPPITQKNHSGVIFNAYPDSIGQRLADTVSTLKRPEFEGAFSMFYVLPTLFNSDLDRGFSVIDYNLNRELATPRDLKALREMKIDLKLDLVLNHLSVASPQFRDLIKHGDGSPFADFFIDWNAFWAGEGEMTGAGYINPHQKHLEKLFMRKPGLPLLKVHFPDGTDRFYWNTFYQEVTREEHKGTHIYLGQMDLNARCEKVWDFYDETFSKLAGYGAKIVRLDAFAYLHKEPGRRNFFNRPGTWNYLDRLRQMGDKYGLDLLPEVHAPYGEGVHTEITGHGFTTYDFFLPGLLIDAIDQGRAVYLKRWLQEIQDKNIHAINMLGCHDGIPVLDLKGSQTGGQQRAGLLSDADIHAAMERIVARGGRVKNLYGPDGRKISYYQVNATYFSALGEDENRLLLARAIQLFMPGVPQVWYLDLFAGRNDDAAADRAGAGGHKEINRTNLTLAEVEAGLESDVVQKQLEMIRLRNNHPAFAGHVSVDETPGHQLSIRWRKGAHTAHLEADLSSCTFRMTLKTPGQADKLITTEYKK